jgi:hypothetical protein
MSITKDMVSLQLFPKQSEMLTFPDAGQDNGGDGGGDFGGGDDGGGGDF